MNSDRIMGFPSTTAATPSINTGAASAVAAKETIARANHSKRFITFPFH